MTPEQIAEILETARDVCLWDGPEHKLESDLAKAVVALHDELCSLRNTRTVQEPTAKMIEAGAVAYVNCGAAAHPTAIAHEVYKAMQEASDVD